MYSLGVILFELYQPFGTESERRMCLDRLRKHGELDETFEKRWPMQV